MDGLWLRMKIRGYLSKIKADQALSYNVVYVKCYEGDYEKCKKLIADKDPESTTYDVSKKEIESNQHSKAIGNAIELQCTDAKSTNPFASYKKETIVDNDSLMTSVEST